MNPAETLASLLIENKLTISTAESCTGGNIAHLITSLPGSSAYFKGSVVSYCNEVKHFVLNVSADDIKQYTAVSNPVARQMAENVAILMNTDAAISTTGIAGPGGATDAYPVGSVWIGIDFALKSGREYHGAELHHFHGSREEIIEQASETAIRRFIEIFTGKPLSHNP